MTFYVYEHWRPDKDECFYVGKGHGWRATILSGRKNQHHKNIRDKLTSLGLGFEVRMVAEGLDEATAFALEKERIAYWRAKGVKLANRTNGGEGFSGGRHGPEARKRIGDSSRGKKRDAAIGAKISASLKGRKFSSETIARMSAAQKIRAENTNHMEKLRLLHIGRVHSKEEKLKRANSIRRSRYINDNAQYSIPNL